MPASYPKPTDHALDSGLQSILQRIATGPELSKDISFEEARDAMRCILDGEVDPVQAGIFLIALRMKRETDDENRGVLQALIDVSERAIADVDEVVDVADPYDGYARGLPASPFLPSVLAACDVPAISQGAESVGPKYGATHRKVLRAAGRDVDLTVSEAAGRLSHPDCGWAYVDQSKICPDLHALLGLRQLIVKRPCITTVEVLLRPISGRARTHLMTGYVHKPYPPIYTMLARQSGFTSAMIVRGVEGGVVPSLSQPAKLHRFMESSSDQEWRIKPRDVGVNCAVRAVPLPMALPARSGTQDDVEASIDAEAIASAAAEAGLGALRGEPGPMRDSLVYAGALCLTHLGRSPDLKTAADSVREVLDSGEAHRRFHP
ncbi:MAG: anthranilate phosphoribosyltransferase [Gammaproteobacteria bacterium]|nr:anthranilate phosphoribosyltransferase [Gammaproteobacteria bacterium]